MFTNKIKSPRHSNSLLLNWAVLVSLKFHCAFKITQITMHMALLSSALGIQAGVIV